MVAFLPCSSRISLAKEWKESYMSKGGITLARSDTRPGDLGEEPKEYYDETL
jgi:hypothetical protein